MPTINSYKTKNGTKYEYRAYVERFGKSVQIHKRGFSSRAEAKAAAEDIVESNGKTYSNSITFGKLYEEYHRAYVLRNKKQSVRRIESYFNNHMLPFFRDSLVNKITEKDYMNWQEKILDKNFADSYNSGLHTAMVSILKYAQKYHNLNRNVAQEVGGFRKRNIKKKIEVWSFEEFKKYISVVDELRDKALYTFMYETGTRFGEATAILFKDYHGTYVDIDKTISKELDANREHIINNPKTPSSNRRVTLSKNVINYINQLKEYYSNMVGFNDEWYIFGGLKPYAHTTATTHKNKYCKMAGVKQITFHSFRHSHASIMLNSGIPITNVSERLGHSNPGITLGIYSHVIKKEDDPIIDKLNQLNS